MTGPILFPAVALLGLIWATGQIVQATLSQREKIGTLVGFDLVAWAIFVGLALNTPAIPSPYSIWLAVAISIAFIIYLVYRYRPKRARKLPRTRLKDARLDRDLSRLVLFNKANFTFSCIIEVWSAYILYQVAYARGGYDSLLPLDNLSNLHPFPPDMMTTFIRGIISSSIGIALGTIGIAIAFYYHGLSWGVRNRPKNRTRTKRRST